MADIVKETSDVQINNMVQMLYLYQSATLRDCGLCGAIWAETIGVFAELRFTDRFHDLQDALLHHAVNNRGNAQRSCFAVGLGYLHAPDRTRVIAAELSSDEPDKIRFAQFCEIVYCPVVYSGSMASGVAFDRSVGQLDVFFALDDFHEAIEHLSGFAFRVQPVKDSFHIVILGVPNLSLLAFPFLLLRSQHRHPLLSVWIFFVILEAAFIVCSFSS
jgi:hypothetical protein